MAIAIFVINSSIYAQDESIDRLQLSVDVASGFVWRGITLNTTPVFQPSFTFTSGKFFIGAWASTPFVLDGWNSYYQGLDLFVGFQLSPSFTIGLTDYYQYNYGWRVPTYFNYKKEDTDHAFDLQLIYDGSSGFPLKTTISTIIAGNDLTYRNNTLKRNFSTYIELGYGSSFNGFDWEICAGIVPMSSELYETDGFSLINLGFGFSKSFEITPTYSLPLSLNFTVNPAAESVFLVATISLF